ncbi:hypothetical protein LSM04_001895 [Trypanosoma melophagium]|uniref:uncharacterized protein n=1 Tax=Trypanosoma melophagium TaxID=715481 RepID=UPI00351A8C22|nr:hypothetical protein LSM04_001895 [Trypanosoma melophagium]
MKVRYFVRITVAVAIGYVAYRGMRSFFRNEITLGLTEVVHLLPSEGTVEMDGGTQLYGEIQCETYLMRSYRFLMKLSANVKGGTITPNTKVRSRNRVMHATENGSYKNLTNSIGSKKRDGSPTIVVNKLNPMVDGWELVGSGNLCFTPACIGDELLLCYEGNVKAGSLPSAVVRNCYLHPDDTPGLKRLVFDLVVYDVVHAVRISVKLPNHYCDVVAVHTSGVGRVEQPNPRKPHHLVWEIGTVDETTWKGVSSLGPGVLPEARLARRGFTDDDLAAAALRNNKDMEDRAALANTHLLSEFTDPRFEDSVDYEGKRRRSSNDDYNVGTGMDDNESNSSMPFRREHSGLPEGTHLLIANFILVFEEPDGVEYDYVSSDSDEDNVEDEHNTVHEVQSSKRRKDKREMSPASRGSTKRSAKREERARKKEQLRQRSADAILTAGRGVSTHMPEIEFSYSVAGLASGMTIRRLQTVSERPNWVPRSLLDFWLLRWMIPGIHKRRLGKYAHYTTWFIQPVVVASF